MRMQRPAMIAMPQRGESSLSKAQLQSFGSAIAALNRPWPELLLAFESVPGDKVSLLTIEARPEDRVIRVSAAAEHMQDLLDYMQRLAAVRPFVRLAPIRQEVRPEGGSLPMHAVFELQWEESS